MPLSPKTLVALPCRLSRSAFSGERVFRIEVPGVGTHTGVAPRYYCWTREGQSLQPDEPGPGQTIEGRVAGHLIESNEDKAAVALPDGETVVVPTGQIFPRPPEGVPHVPVGP